MSQSPASERLQLTIDAVEVSLPVLSKPNGLPIRNYTHILHPFSERNVPQNPEVRQVRHRWKNQFAPYDRRKFLKSRPRGVRSNPTETFFRRWSYREYSSDVGKRPQGGNLP